MVTQAVKDNTLKWYCRWYALKFSKDVGGCYYFDYTDRKFARLIGGSVNTARNWKSRFIQYGWCEVTPQGHLKFKSERKIIAEKTGKFHKKLYKIEVRYSKPSLMWDSLFDELAHELIVRKKKTMHLATHKAKPSDSKKTRVEQGKADVDGSLALSYESLGDVWGVSKSSAFNTIRRLEAKGMISKLNLKAKISDCRLPLEGGKIFSTMKGSYVQLSNRYFFDDCSEKNYMRSDNRSTRNYMKRTVVVDLTDIGYDDRIK